MPEPALEAPTRTYRIRAERPAVWEPASNVRDSSETFRRTKARPQSPKFTRGPNNFTSGRVLVRNPRLLMRSKGASSWLQRACRTRRDGLYGRPNSVATSFALSCPGPRIRPRTSTDIDGRRRNFPRRHRTLDRRSTHERAVNCHEHHTGSRWIDSRLDRCTHPDRGRP